jgi:hypothetical protein
MSRLWRTEIDPQDEVELAFNQGIQAVFGHWYNKIFRRISKPERRGAFIHNTCRAQLLR